MKPDKKNNKENPKFKVRISKCKNIFAKGYVSIWSDAVFVITKVKILFHGHILLVVLMVEKLSERFPKKNCKKQMKKNLV